MKPINEMMQAVDHFEFNDQFLESSLPTRVIELRSRIGGRVEVI